MLDVIYDLSRLTRHALTGDNRSWCAWAWENRGKRTAWPFLALCGRKHCRASWLWYDERKERT